MKYKYYILSTPDDFYMADAICRELEKTGESCYYNLRDSRKADKMPDSYDKIGSETSLISVVNEEFFTNHSLSSPVSFYSKNTSEDKVFALQNGPINEFPVKWNDFVWLDATTGLNGDIISVVKGELPAESQSISPKLNLRSESKSISTSIHSSDLEDEVVCYRVERHYFDDSIEVEEGMPLTLQRAIRYYNGDGVPEDEDRAYTLFKKAVSENPDSFQAQYYWGVCCELELGEGKPEDAPVAYEKAIELSSNENDTNAATKRLAIVKYDAGDFKRARDLFTKVVEFDPVYGAYGLGLIDEAENKYEDALEHYSEAAELGEGYAQNALGCLYVEGKGVKQNEDKALEWFIMAANDGIIEAMVNAGMRLINIDDEECMTTGKELLKDAAENGFEEAELYLKDFEERQIAEQRSKRQEQSRNHRDNDEGNNGSSGGNAWGAFLNGLDLPGLVDYAKGRL